MQRTKKKKVIIFRLHPGLDIVKKVESFGSESGKTSKKIVIAKSGQL